MFRINETHNPALKSWVESANTIDTDFPIQNLPFGVFSHNGDSPRGGVAIGDCIFDIKAGLENDLFSGRAKLAAKAACQGTLNELMSLGPIANSSLRSQISEILCLDSRNLDKVYSLRNKLVVPMEEARLELPCDIRNFTDFLSSIHHTERAGKLKGLEVPVPPVFKYLPVAYHSRATSIVLSGSKISRPYGQWRNDSGTVRFGTSESLDYELEIALIIAKGNELGSPIPVNTAKDYFFGYCLLNDWSNKEIQWWEQMLGPFLGKSFATSISPWIITAEALAPFHAPANQRAVDDPKPLGYLYDIQDQREGGLSIELEVYLLTSKMREEGINPTRITKTNTGEMYWTFSQMVAHHTVNGCNLLAGDVIASGTLSGEFDESRACLAEITTRGTKPLTLENGQKRSWLEDGDDIIFRGKAIREGYRSIGFGECRGQIQGNSISWLDDERT